MFAIEFSNQSKKIIKKLDSRLCKRVIGKIEILSNTPVLNDSIKLIGDRNTYRIRVGKIRVLYKIFYSKSIVLIVKIDFRGRVYK